MVKMVPEVEIKLQEHLVDPLSAIVITLLSN